MNVELVERFNELVSVYEFNGQQDLLGEIQLWELKYELKLIDNPNEKFESTILKEYQHLFSYNYAYSKYHLILPLLLFLFTQHKENKPALETSLLFMESCKGYLQFGEFSNTKTGVQIFSKKC